MEALAGDWSVSVVGVKFRPGYPRTVLEREVGETLELRHDPSPEYPNAVAILAEGRLIAYVPERAELAARLAASLDAGEHWKANVWKVHAGDNPGLEVRFRRFKQVDVGST